MKHARVDLRLVSGPWQSALVSAPPILDASSHTIDYTCAACGTVLMHAEEGQVHGLTILCQSCGSYNSTDPELPLMPSL